MKQLMHIFSSNLVQRNQNTLFLLMKAGWIITQLIGIMAGLTRGSSRAHTYSCSICVGSRVNTFLSYTCDTDLSFWQLFFVTHTIQPWDHILTYRKAHMTARPSSIILRHWHHIWIPGPWPAPCSVLIMDNCTIHHLDSVAALCDAR